MKIHISLLNSLHHPSVQTEISFEFRFPKIMKVKHRRIFNLLKAKGIYPLTTTIAKYAEAVEEVVLQEIGHPGASRDSERPLFRRVADLSFKFAKNARRNWKKGSKSTRKEGFFEGEMEVIIFFWFQLDFKSFACFVSIVHPYLLRRRKVYPSAILKIWTIMA